MKKFVYFLLIFTVVFSACEKNEKPNFNSEIYPNNAEPIYSASKQIIGYKLSVMVGHSGTNCPGCVTQGGDSFHVPCQGAGSACSQSATVYIYTDGDSPNFYYAVNPDKWELTDGDFFLMPDRSLYIVGSNGEFLNIPEQVAYRDEETGFFIFYEIFFSDEQVFDNK